MYNPDGAAFTVSGNSSQPVMSAHTLNANTVNTTANIISSGTIVANGNITSSGNVIATNSITAARVNNTGQFYYNTRTISANVTIAATENAMSVGPITIADGVEVVIADGGEWSVV
jgi:hypothetical protein